MAERNEKSARPAERQARVWETEAEIEVTFTLQPEPTFQFAGVFFGEGGTLAPDGTIDISGKTARLTFNLSQLSEAAEFVGIQLGWFGPPLSDTQGGRYPMPEHPPELPSELPFVIRCTIDTQGRKQTLILEDLHDPPCTIIAYQLSVRDEAGQVYRHDPKIYNKGPTGGGGGSARTGPVEPPGERSG
jgi:hypothetical protein